MGITITQQKIAVIGIEWDVIDLIESIPYFEIVGFLDADSTGAMGGYPYLGDDYSWGMIKQTQPDLKAILTLDVPVIRSRLFMHYSPDALATVVSPHSYTSPRAVIGPGSIIQRGVTIMANVRIGCACKINVNATVHHDAQIGDFCTIAPGALVLGRVVVEHGVYIGAGAIIRQRCKLGAGSVIGAGAVVTRDVPPGVTVVGIPAREKIF